MVIHREKDIEGSVGLAKSPVLFAFLSKYINVCIAYIIYSLSSKINS